MRAPPCPSPRPPRPAGTSGARVPWLVADLKDHVPRFEPGLLRGAALEDGGDRRGPHGETPARRWYRPAARRLSRALRVPHDETDLGGDTLADHRARHGHEPHFDEPTPLGTEHGQLALLVGRRRGDDPLEHARLGHGPRTERDDDVAVLQTRARRRPPFDDLDDQDAEPLANPVAGLDLLHLLLPA